MDKKDEGGLRFSDLIKKGAKEIKRQNGQSVTDDGRRETEAFRLSDLDSLRQKGRPREAAEDISGSLDGRKGEKEQEGQEIKGFSFRDLEGLKEERKGSSHAGSSPVADGESVTSVSEQPRDRISLKDYESFKSTKKAQMSLRIAPQHRDVDLKRWWMGDAKTGRCEDGAAESRREGVGPSDQVTQGIRHESDVEGKKTAEAASVESTVELLAEESKNVAERDSSVADDIPAPAQSHSGVGTDRDIIIHEGAMDADALYAAALAFVQGVKSRVSAKEPAELLPAIALISRMTESQGTINDLSRLTIRIIAEEDYNISHQVNVMIYALKLGFGLNYSKEKLLELGLSALMHDVGMFRIPEGIALKSGRLTEREIDVIKTHAEIGRDVLNLLRSPYASLPSVAYEHHEREGGQGYPQGLKGNEIHEYARIVGLVDSYEAMTHNRPYRKALMQCFSAKELIKSRSALFSQLVIKVFLKEISLYPLGSYVILNNKSIGEVVATDYNHPLRPTVKMIYDGEGNQVRDDVMIRLKENPLFFIVDGVSPEELPANR